MRAGQNTDMDKRQRRKSMQHFAGILTWAAVTGLAFYILYVGGDRIDANGVVAVAMALTNLASMLTVFSNNPHISLMHRRIAHGVMAGSALVLGLALPVSFVPIYTIIWIAVAGRLYPERTLWWLLVAALAAWYVVMRFAWGEEQAFITVLLYGTFHFFALLMTRATAAAEAARDRAEFLNRELLSTQHLLSEASRHSERTRIARDLHDLVGHHLTALSINLQIAERLAGGEAKEKIAESRALARLLLSDVREAVSTLREEADVDFASAVRLLVDKVPQLDIELEIEEGLSITDFEVAESLLRCIQEALTNTLRHSGASESRIRVWQEDGALHLDIRDNGAQQSAIVEGNGITGMRERLERLRGTLELSAVNGALRLRVTIPAAA
jgi:two-component system sensor histidine kinase DesK